MTHTPGPWAIVNNHFVATVNEDGSIPLNSKIVAELSDGNADLCKADLRLIAAAPTLLEASQEIIEAIDRGLKPKASDLGVNKLRKAIAQAKGESK